MGTLREDYTEILAIYEELKLLTDRLEDIVADNMPKGGYPKKGNTLNRAFMHLCRGLDILSEIQNVKLIRMG